MVGRHRIDVARPSAVVRPKTLDMLDVLLK